MTADYPLPRVLASDEIVSHAGDLVTPIVRDPSLNRIVCIGVGYNLVIFLAAARLDREGVDEEDAQQKKGLHRRRLLRSSSAWTTCVSFSRLM